MVIKTDSRPPDALVAELRKHANIVKVMVADVPGRRK
jgi:hypothetical protein